MTVACPEPKLLMITERFAPDLGGVARSAFRTANAISRLGWAVHVFAWTKSLPAGTLETSRLQSPSDPESNLVVHRMGLFSGMDLSMQHTFNVLEWLHERNTYSATWGHYLFPAGYMSVVAAETFGIPSTVSARGNDIDRLMFPPGDFSRLIWTLQRARAVSCVSADLASKAKMLLQSNQQPFVIPNVVDASTFRLEDDRVTSSLRKTLGILPEESVLGFCGELRHKKGLPFLLDALTEVRASRPACLLIIGEVRPREASQLNTFALEHPESASRILISGNLESPEDVADHFHLCDVILQPSVWDGLPNALLEAMACGKIVIASDAGGIPEVVEHGKDGFLIPKALLNQLGTAVIEVLNLGPSEKKKISTAARKKVVDFYNQETEATNLLNLLTYLMNESTSKSSNSR